MVFILTYIVITFPVMLYDYTLMCEATLKNISLLQHIPFNDSRNVDNSNLE